jgi:hypothetical protein
MTALRSMIDVDEVPLPAVVGVAVLGNNFMRLLFDDGLCGDVLIPTEDMIGVFEPLRDPAYFVRVRVDLEAGTIVWPNGAYMAPEALYQQAEAGQLL